MTWKLDTSGLSYNGLQVASEYNNLELDSLVLKTSPDNTYAAVCNKDSFYADFYTITQADDGIKYPSYLYSLRRNTYRTEGTRFLLEFFPSPIVPTQTLFIFNMRHGVISVCDAESGQELHTDLEQDKFITTYKIIEEYRQPYLYVEGWYWGPKLFTSIYRIKDLLVTPFYDGIVLDTDRHNAKGEYHCRLTDSDNNGDKIEGLPSDHPFNTKYGITDFITNHKAIKEYFASVKLTESFINNKDNLLHRLLKVNDQYVVFNDHKAKRSLETLLSRPLQDDFNDLIVYQCVDKVGNDVRTAVKCFSEDIIYVDTSFNYLVPRLIAKGSTRFTIPKLDIKLTLKRKDLSVQIKIKQTFRKLKVVGDQDIYEIDCNEPCYITVRG